VAAATALVKAATDDSSSSTSSSSGEEERREQEREAERRRKRERLETSIVNLKRNRLESARTLYARAAQVLGKQSGSTVGLTVSRFEEALNAKIQATSEYARALSSVLSIDGASNGACTSKELDRFRVNLQALDSLSSGMGISSPLTGLVGAVLSAQQAATGQLSVTVLSEAEREDLAALSDASNRLERLQRLKNEIEQQA
jgi:hypothetical protein